MDRRRTPDARDPRARKAVLSLGADPGHLHVRATVDGTTYPIRDVTSLRMFIGEQRAAVTPSQSRALGVLHVLFTAAELGSVDSATLRPTIDSYRPAFDDSACTDAFTAGEETALFDLRAVPPAPLLPALRKLAAAAL